MRIYLVQHGHAESKETDPERPLSATGRRQVERLTAFFARHHDRVAAVFHSGRTRARETAELLLWAVEPHGRPEEKAGIGPEDPVEPVAQEMERWDTDTMLVGHQPFLGRFVSRLVSGDEARPLVQFVPGSAVSLERTAAGGWVIAWMVSPDLLAD